MIPAWRRSRVAAALVTSVSLALAVAAVEASLRLFAPIHLAGIRDSFQYDPELGYRLKPGIHRLETTDHRQEIRTNSLGTVNFQESFKDYRSLVFASGDSYTQGTGLPSDAAYPLQLDLILNTAADGLYEKRYGVVNLGLAAFGGEQSVITLRRYAQVIGKPDVVLCLGAENDYQDDILFRSGYRHRHLVDGSPRWGWLLRPCDGWPAPRSRSEYGSFAGVGRNLQRMPGRRSDPWLKWNSQRSKGSPLCAGSMKRCWSSVGPARRPPTIG